MLLSGTNILIGINTGGRSVNTSCFKTWMPTATPEELSNQYRSKKISDSAETKETELDVLQRQRNKRVKD